MEVSGEVADLLVREGLQVAEVAAKLAGKGIVSAAALIVALLKGNYKAVGKVGVNRLNKENAEAVIVPIRAEDLSKFEKLAKQGALYAAVQSKASDSEVVHIISNVNYSAQLNTILQIMGYEEPERRRSSEVKKEPATPREKSYPERRSGSTASRNEEKPSVRDTLERLKTVADKALPRSERGKDKTR